jgi:hypothetical protein
MTAHACQDCGMLHDTPVQQESEAVAIARIQAENALALARISAREDRNWNETRVEVAEIEAEAEVASATAEAEVIGEIIAAEGAPAEGEAGEPIVVELPDPPAEPEPAAAEPPVVETHPVKETKGGGYWSAYR